VKDLEYSCCVKNDLVGDGSVTQPRVAGEVHEKVLEVLIVDDVVREQGRG
jgi:hypothetical protein